MQYSIVNLSEIKYKSEGLFILSPDFFSKDNYDCLDKLNDNNCVLLDFFEPNKKTIKKIEEKSINYDLTNSLGNFLENGELIDKINCEKISLEEGSFIISRLRSYLMEFAIVEKKHFKQIASTEYLSYFPKNENVFSSELLLVFTKTKYVQRILKNSQYGTEHPRFYDFVFDKIPINSKILRLNQKVKELIRYCFKLRQSADTLYKEAEEILLEELGLKNYQPQNKKCFVKMLSDTQEAGRIDAEYFQPKYEDVIDKIKKYKGGYDILENISEIKKCIEPGSSEYKEDGIPFVRVSNLDKFGLNAKNQQYISEAFYKKNIEYQPQKGEILLSKDGSLGIAYCLYHEPKQMICSGGIVRLIENKIEPLCLALVLNSIICQMQIEKTSGGALIAHWLVDDIKNMIIPLLPQSIQSQISAKIQQSFESREKSKQLLEVAKRALEIAIEENEEAGLKYIEENK